MTNDCRDLELLLSARAAGALDADETARLETHLAGCEACRAETVTLAEAVGLARLPPPAEGELHALDGLERRILASWSRSERRRAARRRLAVGVAVAAAAAAMILAPGVLRHAPQPAQGTTAAAAWQVPDLDELWAESAAADPGADDDSTSEEGVLLAAIEDTDAM